MGEREQWLGILKAGDTPVSPLDSQSAALIVIDRQPYSPQPLFPCTDVLEKLPAGFTTGYRNRVCRY